MAAEFKAEQCVLNSERSAAFARFCECVYGKSLNQYGTADMQQIDELIEILQLNQGSHVLDIGCGIGTMGEYIAQQSGAEITGVDNSEALIARARERYRDSPRLHFAVMDMNDLKFPPSSFDAVISIDSHYFAKDLDRTMAGFCRVLKDGGQMGLFHTHALGPNDPQEGLGPEAATVGRVLANRGLRFTALDQTKANLELWQRMKQAAQDLEAELEAGGNGTLCKGRFAESDAVLALAKEGKFRRYLYHVRLGA